MARNEKRLRSALIRLAHARPELRSHLLPLVRRAGRAQLDEDVEEGLRIIHNDRKVRYSLESDVRDAFSALNNAGQGYAVGEETDDIESISEAGRLLDTADHGSIAVYWNRHGLTLVGDVHGPWAVDVDFD